MEALAITIDLGLTKKNYETLNSYLRHKNVNVLPPYRSTRGQGPTPLYEETETELPDVSPNKVQ